MSCSALSERLQTKSASKIKKAYRRKALELHPDRNLHDTETATRRFAEVQTAYEILSDPQERAWYDSHRDAILRGDDGTDGAGGDSTSSYYNNVRLTPTEEIYTLMGRFNSSVPFNDSPAGFFGILKMFFAQLALEEEAACSWDSQAEPVQYAPFGSAADDYETVAKPFYRDWSNFSTQKSFSWKDKYRLSDAPERAVRRIMEKENRKAREQAIREFNDAVRSLVVFVRKRDPRYVPNTQSEAERQKILRDSATGQAARQRAANQERLAAAANYTEPEWAKVQPADRGAEFEGGFPSDAESEVQEEIECVVCNKTFKSEKQFEAHEKSKKHTKAVQQLRRQMKKENLDFELDIKPEPQLPEEEEDTKSEVEVAHDAVAHDDDGYGDRQTSKGGNVELDDAEGDDEDDDDDDDEDDEYASREAVEKRFRPINTSSDEDDDGVDKKLTEELDGLDIKETPEKKVGKAKAKREKKAARAAAASQQPETTCKVCHESFSSNTRLHKHLRVAHPIPVPISKAKAGGKKKKDQKG